MIKIYLDWNVFNKLERLESLSGTEFTYYKLINDLIGNPDFEFYYSNAHLNDLYRGFLKNPDYTEGHLDNIEHITDNNCIVQYWGNDYVTVQERDVKEFFNSIKEEGLIPTQTFGEFMTERINEWNEVLPEIKKNPKTLSEFNTNLKKVKLWADFMQEAPLPWNFYEIYDADPIFEKLFPLSKLLKNYVALYDDLAILSDSMTKDFSIYKTLKQFTQKALKDQEQLKSFMPQSDEEGPKYLTYDDAFSLNESKTSKNPAYDEITNLFLKIDMKGYKTDEKFANMIDDALHTFYAAYCDIFITIDDKCLYKAKEVYKELGIDTKVLKPEEFYTSNIINRTK